ncbi:MAG: protein-disulfide reductase DsbD, partial [Holophaga sp.]|nr:protein-disulfide reductase DsbD [Holophaga sp.]
TLKFFLLTLAFSLAAWAQRAPNLDPEQDVKVAFQKGAVVVTVPEGAHLKKSFMEVTLKSKPGSLKAGPLPKTTGVDELNDPVWHGTVRIPVMGEGLSGEVQLEVQYQPCTEGEGGVCYPPTVQLLKVKAADIPAIPAAKAAGSGEEKVETKSEVTPAVSPMTTPAVVVPSPIAPPERQGLFLALILVFLAGMGASLTPCVYPMIPITMAIIGAKGGGKAKGFALSLMLVLGMAVTYTVLGVVAAKSGAAFGAFAQKPAFLIPVSLLFGVFALSLFGAFEIQLPQSLQAKLQGSGPRQGFLGAFLMGLVLGPLAAPCVGPVIGAVLVGIAQQGDVFLGGLKLFVFTLGMGVLFMLVGTFSAGLPKSGNWLTRFKQIMGLVVLAFAAWNVRLLAPEWLNFAMWTLTLLVGAGVFGAFETAEGLVPQLRRGFAILLLTLGLLVGIKSVEGFLNVRLLPQGGAVASNEPAHKSWLEQDFEGALKKAKAENKLVLVDIYAEWCAQCKELDEKTWPDATVQEWIAKNAIAVRIDTDAKRKDLQPLFKITGYPTVMLMDAEGKEVRPRLMGFEKPEAMLRWLAGRS